MWYKNVPHLDPWAQHILSEILWRDGTTSDAWKIAGQIPNAYFLNPWFAFEPMHLDMFMTYSWYECWLSSFVSEISISKKMKTKVPRFFSFHSYYPIHPNIKRKIPHRPRCCWESPRNPRWSRSVRGFSDSGWIFGLILKNIYGKTMETMENHGYLPRNQSRNVKFQELCIMGQWNSSCNSPPDK